MKSISIKFSSKFKNFLEISEEILREVDNLSQEEAIYYIYANNPIKYSLSIHNLIKNIKREEKVNITSTNNIIRNLLLTPIDELDYQVMILDIKKETNYNDNTKKPTIKNQINKILTLSNENFLSPDFETLYIKKPLITNNL